jgi:hypothetical protein
MATLSGHNAGTSPSSFKRDAFAGYMSQRHSIGHRLSFSGSLLSAEQEAIDEDSAEEADQPAHLRDASQTARILRTSRPASMISERSALLGRRANLLAGQEVQQLESDIALPFQGEDVPKRAMVKQEWQILLKYTAPIVATHTAQYSLTLVTVLPWAIWERQSLLHRRWLA